MENKMKQREIICKWCGKIFKVPPTRRYNATKYCCEKCRKSAWKEQNLKAQHRYQLRYKWLFKDADKRLGEVRLGVKPEADFIKEAKQIRRELRRIRKC